MGKILLFNKFFSDVDKCVSCEDITRLSCAMVADDEFLAIFACCILSEPHVAHFRPAS